MKTIDFVLQILALVCFIAAAVGVTSPKLNLIATGLGLWLLADMIHH
jgi:hypothetical protein